MSKPAPKQDKPDNPAQYARFVEMARELGAEGTAADFDRALQKVLAAKKVPRPQPKPRKMTKR